VAEGFAYHFKVLSFGIVQQEADSTQNPDNDFLQLSRYGAELEVRPDVRLTLWRFEFGVKPRFTLAGRVWDTSQRAGDSEVDTEVFVQEWLARVKLTEQLFVSYGRENLQWGPAWLFSPSNPFFRDNGRLNSKREVPGMDFARVVWLPGGAWTLSLIANVDEGRQEFRAVDFQKTYALRLDYVGSAAYVSLIPSYQEGERVRLGWFGGWTATDALLVYAEGTVSPGSPARYPVPARNPFGSTLVALHDDSTALASTILLGASYTFAAGPTLSGEYVYNSPGYSSTQAEAYYRLRQQAAEALPRGGPLGNLARLTLSQTADTGLRLLRRHYVLVQYVHSNIQDALNLTLRWTQNLDDRSGQFNYTVEYLLGNSVQLFAVGMVNVGGQHTEFRTFLDYQIMVGVELSF
jgi:hypothetical protein